MAFASEYLLKSSTVFDSALRFKFAIKSASSTNSVLPLNEMTILFRLGLVIVTSDVQRYMVDAAEHTLPASYKLNPPAQDATVRGSAVPMPSLDVASWVYMVLGLGKVDDRPSLAKGPYTAQAGYLQLKAPIVRPDSAAQSAS
ncbi:hypothetical protein C7999DRAFT_30351 [Corynascus novoguineensis]|uniref:Uncharacterized protein n=1 Tax=Corynascus novoguineensis TaxID=1126955 RepID=A0AAN7HRK3_9PEZI|nr:hypothetical protein C7999DRAFT_30351 [Corynascus novoguineensis]